MLRTCLFGLPPHSPRSSCKISALFGLLQTHPSIPEQMDFGFSSVNHSQGSKVSEKLLTAFRNFAAPWHGLRLCGVRSSLPLLP